MMLRTFGIVVFTITSLVASAQTYEVIEIDLVCESREIEGFNTKGSEFCPFVHENTFYFTSSREYDMAHYGENNWKRAGYLNLFRGDLRGDITEATKVKDVELFSERIKTNNHTGPMTLSFTGDTLFFTQVNSDGKENRKAKVKPQLYMAVRDGSTWGDVSKLTFCDPQYSFGHPYYDSKSKRLYFSSDMKGGAGGKDIYYTEYKGGQWTTPVNFKEANGPHDELFPFVQDQTVFFASNRDGGMGGLDIYWMPFGAITKPQLLSGVNSTGDDFGIYVFPGMTKGYFSSNRTELNDDIYFLYMDKKVTVKKELAGRFTYRNLQGQASGISIQVIGENDEILFEGVTGPEGEFIFRNVEYAGSFRIKPMSEEDLELVLYDANGNATTTLMTDEFGEFTYKKLSGTSSGYLSLIPEDMIDLKLNTGHLSGQFVYEAFPGRYPAAMTVNLRDENGVVKTSTKTDEHGNFEFKQLSLSENYILHMDEIDAPLVLLIFDKSGNVVAQLKTDKSGQFIYRKLDPSYSKNLSKIPEGEDAFTLETQTISGMFQYKNLSGISGKNLTIMAYNEDGILMEQIKTDDKGYFRFRNLELTTNVLFKLDESDPNLHPDDYTLYIFDRDGNKVAQLRRGQNGFFIYKPLGFETSDLTHVKDSVDFSLTISSNYDIMTVYFGSNQENVSSSDVPTLNKIHKMMKDNPKLKMEVNAYADSRSSDEYNLVLSQKRGDWVVDFMQKKGIDKNRFIVNAYGETKLVSADQHELNRRAEIRIYQ
jgi:outer membrane protein OmpA-like peptidoglycan-associated protein